MELAQPLVALPKRRNIRYSMFNIQGAGVWQMLSVYHAALHFS
jgi:hypothetical protein